MGVTSDMLGCILSCYFSANVWVLPLEIRKIGLWGKTWKNAWNKRSQTTIAGRREVNKQKSSTSATLNRREKQTNGREGQVYLRWVTHARQLRPSAISLKIVYQERLSMWRISSEVSDTKFRCECNLIAPRVVDGITEVVGYPLVLLIINFPFDLLPRQRFTFIPTLNVQSTLSHLSIHSMQRSGCHCIAFPRPLHQPQCFSPTTLGASTETSALRNAFLSSFIDKKSIKVLVLGILSKNGMLVVCWSIVQGSTSISCGRQANL